MKYKIEIHAIYRLLSINKRKVVSTNILHEFSSEEEIMDISSILLETIQEYLNLQKLIPPNNAFDFRGRTDDDCSIDELHLIEPINGVKITENDLDININNIIHFINTYFSCILLIAQGRLGIEGV